jgi:1-acyl-sn-glycerol-3-phosphate acyltransferase
VPVAMLGAFEAQRGRKYFPRRRPRIRAVVGPPVDVQAVLDAQGGVTEAELLRAVTDAVMDSIQDLSGQERVDEYAITVKRRLRAAEDAPRDPEEPGTTV